MATCMPAPSILSIPWPTLPDPVPLPFDVRQVAFWILIGLHVVLIGADLYVAWTEGLFKLQ